MENQQTLEPIHTPLNQSAPASSETPLPAIPSETTRSPETLPPAKLAQKKPQDPKIKNTSRQSGNNITLAIIATIIIILALAGLAVFAYTKSQK